MSDDGQVVTHMHLSTIEKWMEQSHQAQMETNKSIATLAESVNELVTQEKIRAERDVVTAERILKVEEKQAKYEDVWKWSAKHKEMWDAYVKKFLAPLIITGIITAIAVTGGFAIYQGG